MKYLILLTLLLACSPTTPIPKVDVGECILGSNMAVWKLLRKEDSKYLFVQYPEIEGAPIHALTDLAAFKKVDCPTQGLSGNVR